MQWLDVNNAKFWDARVSLSQKVQKKLPQHKNEDIKDNASRQEKTLNAETMENKESLPSIKFYLKK